jgi:hypothetical protein
MSKYSSIADGVTDAKYNNADKEYVIEFHCIPKNDESRERLNTIYYYDALGNNIDTDIGHFDENGNYNYNSDIKEFKITVYVKGGFEPSDLLDSIGQNASA